MADKQRTVGIAHCRAQVHTDSLTVLLDLTKVTPSVVESLRNTLRLSDNSAGQQLAAQEITIFQENTRAAFNRHRDKNYDEALEFAVVISAFLHECRHVHDMRATRIGAELLLSDLKVYAGVNQLLTRLALWRQTKGGKRIRLPIGKYLSQFDGEFEDIRHTANAASTQRGRVSWWWKAPSRGPTLPGHSIHTLFETLGFLLQMEWLAVTFGDEVAEEIRYATVGDNASSTYLRPVIVLSTICQAYGLPFDPEPHDLSILLLSALNIDGLAKSFNDTKASERHPGTWFDTIGAYYRAIVSKGNVAEDERAIAAFAHALTEAGYKDWSEWFASGDKSVEQLQREVFSEALFPSGNPATLEPTLVATEVAIDYREMQRVTCRDRNYHVPMKYIQLLVEGGLTAVYVRVIESGRAIHDFRTASEIPSNHIGGARHASEASQRMRLLLQGTSDPLHQTAFEKFIYKEMQEPAPHGFGLKFIVD